MDWRGVVRGGLLAGLGLTVVGLAGCTAPRSVQINQVDYASQYSQNGPQGDLTVYWSGSPNFPLRVTITPPAGCSQGPLTCEPGTSTPLGSAGPLVWPKA